MALVTGSFTTAHGGSFPSGSMPGLSFTPSMPAITVGGTVVSTFAQEVTPAADRSFSVDLTPTTFVSDPDFHYIVTGYYLVPDGYGGSGFTKVDVFEYRLYVPSAGGRIGELVQGGRPAEAFVFFDPTWSSQNPPTVLTPGAIYVSADPTNPDLGTGQIWKVK